jgi:hypothetical protein
LRAGLAAATMLIAVPASAAPFLFQLTGSRTATFTIDTNTPTDFFSQNIFGNQISYNNVTGSYAGAPGTATIGFGTSIYAQLNVGNAALGFTQFGGPDLFTIVGTKPVFNIGTFALTSIVSGASTLRISAVAAAVPEPATWAMMLVGFGMIAAGLRYRRRSTSVSFG